ncbi:MAG: class I tRNA ligase family protein, partial [Oscillospiraceae bacterium]|nr:class I tRNA ligase family protein [Oscillospiraceae bacterium]
TIHNFCVVDMSNFYLDVIKDRLYTSKKDSKERRAAQTCMYTILDAIVRLIAPILCYTSDEIWLAMPHKAGDNPEGVIFNDMPKVEEAWKDDELEAKWERILAVKSDVSKALELARREKTIGKSLDARVEIFAAGEPYKFVSEIPELATILIVSEAVVTEGEGEGIKGENEPGITVKVSVAEGEKCERCWVKTTTVGSDPEHPTLCHRCAETLKN